MKQRGRIAIWTALLAAWLGALDASAQVDVSVAQSNTPVVPTVGKDVVFTITVSNAGPDTAIDVTGTDTLPAGWSFIWASSGCSGPSPVICVFGAMAPGASAQKTIVARPNASGPGTNTAAAGSPSQTDVAPTNNTSAAAMNAVSPPAANLVQRYRLYSRVTREHLTTPDLNEYTVLGATPGNWLQEGTAGRSLDNPGSYGGVAAVPYYRLYSPFKHWHYWTADAADYYTRQQSGAWIGEGVTEYVLPSVAPSSLMIHRLTYSQVEGLRLWTVDMNEFITLLAPVHGWIGEVENKWVAQ